MKQVPEWKLKEELEYWKRSGKEVKVLDSCQQDAYPTSLWNWLLWSSTPVTEGYGGASVVKLRILLVKKVWGK